MTDYRAKRSSVLDTLKQELSKGFVEETVEVRGHKYLLRTLSEDDEVWADSLTRVGSAVAMMSSRKVPRLAAAIKAVDGATVENLFLYPDDMPKNERDALDNNPISKRYWLYAQMVYFLSDDATRDFVDELWGKFEDMNKRRDEAIAKIPN